MDNFEKRRVLLWSTSIRVLLVLGIFFFRHHVIWLYALMGAISIASQFFVPAEVALISKYIPQHLLLPANSLFTMTFYSAIIGGFVFGGPLLEIMRQESVLLLITTLFALSWLLIYLLPKTKQVITHVRWSFAQTQKDILAGLSFIKSVIPVTQAILLVTLAQAVISVFMTLGPGIADRILTIKLTDASVVILGPAAVGMIVGALVTGSFGARFRKKKLINWGLMSSALLLLLLATLVSVKQFGVADNGMRFVVYKLLHIWIVPVSFVIFFFLGVANSMVDVSCNTVLQEYATGEMRGRVYGVLQSLISGVALLPVVISGVVADFWGIGTILYMLGTILLVCSFYTSGIAIFTQKKLRELIG